MPEIGGIALTQALDVVFRRYPMNPRKSRRCRGPTDPFHRGHFGIERGIGGDLIEPTIDRGHGDGNIFVVGWGDLNH